MIRRGIALILDTASSILALFVLFILTTRGGVFEISAGIRISAHDPINPLAVCAFLLFLRFFSLPRIPFFNISSWSFDGLADRAWAGSERLVRKISGLEPSAVRTIVFWTIVLSVLLKMVIAFVSFGFYSGDDVEIQEMSFAQLFHWDWQAWELRNPLYSMVFIFPVQWLLKWLGVSATWPLIYAGRLVVIAFSALNLWLVYRIARRLYDSPAVGLMSLFFLALSKIHTAFASSELPRTVSSTFVLLAFWYLLCRKKESWVTILAGCALGVGAAIRFSEVLFILPAALFLCQKRHLGRALWLGAVAATVFLLAVGLSDVLYWRSPFHSLKNVFDYTIVKKLSSRGYQPFHYYFSEFRLWTNFLTLSLALYALRLRNRKIYLWAFSPLILLSVLPHKEPRYLVPAIPFLAIMAGLSAWRVLEQGRKGGLTLKVPPREGRILLFLGGVIAGLLVLAHKDVRYAILALLLIALTAGLHHLWKKRAGGKDGPPTTVLSPAHGVFLIMLVTGLGLIVEIDGFHFRRSEAGIETARYLAGFPSLKVLAIEDYWRIGGRLYLAKDTVLYNIDATRLPEPDYLRRMILEKEPQAVGIRAEYFREAKEGALLQALGFEEAKYTERRRPETYRLFIKSR